MADFYIGEGDTASVMPIQVKALDANGVAQPVNCAGATGVLDVTPIHGGTKIVNAAALTAVDLPTGQFSYTFTAPQTIAGAAAGDGLGKATITFGGGAIESFPNAGFYLITFGPDAPTTAQEYVSPQELTKTLNMSGTTYADQDIKLACSAAKTAIDVHCGRVFTAGSPGEVRTYRPVSPDYLRIDDVTAVTSVVAGSHTLTLTTDYTLEQVAVAKPAGISVYDVLRAPRSSLLGTFGTSNGWGDVVVTGTYGWPAVPATIKMATSILASRYLQRARSAPFAILTFGDGGEVARLTRSDPDVAMLLGPYSRSGMVE